MAMTNVGEKLSHMNVVKMQMQLYIRKNGNIINTSVKKTPTFEDNKH